MRFADQPSMAKDIFVDAAPEAVWQICTDLPRFGEWSPENRGGQWVDADGPAVGIEFLGTQEHPGRGEWQTTCVVSTFEPNEAFAWTLGEIDNPGAVWRFDLTEEDGGTRLKQSVQMGPGPSGITEVMKAMPDKEERIIERRLSEYEAGLTAVLAGIKAAAES